MKGVIISAGYGTRFLPATKTIPKEMFPLIDIPAIKFIIDEFIDTGIEDILIITSRRKKVLEDFFDREIELETFFQNSKSFNKLKKLQSTNLDSVHFLRQPYMRGTGDALYRCRTFIGNEPFVVAYPDDLFLSSTPVVKQLINTGQAFDFQSSVLGLYRVPNALIPRLGVVDYKKTSDPLVLKIHKILEKPSIDKAPSNYASLGRYLLTPEIFPLLKKEIETVKGSGEIFHIPVLNSLASNNKLLGRLISGEWLDTGTPLGYACAVVRIGLEREDIKTQFKEYLKSVI